MKTNAIFWSVLSEDFESHPFQHCYTSFQVQRDIQTDRQTYRQTSRKILTDKIIYSNAFLWTVLNEDYESHPYQHCFTSVQVQTDREVDLHIYWLIDRQINFTINFTPQFRYIQTDRQLVRQIDILTVF